MNKQLFSLLCLTVLATSLPSCRNRKRQEPVNKDQIETMIELDGIIFEEETADEKITKF